MKEYYFYIRVFPDGQQGISIWTPQEKHKLLILIIDQLGNNTSQLESFRSRIMEVRNKSKKELVNYNTLFVYVDGEDSKIGENDFEDSQFQLISTQLILRFIDDAILFQKLYDSGDIKGIIPESKKDDWVIVPKEFVKDEYWNVKNDNSED